MKKPKLPSVLTDSIASNEGDVRFRIYAGELELDQASAELVRMYKQDIVRLRAELAGLRAQT